MTLQDAIREHTRDAADSLNLVDGRRRDAAARQAAAEERIKRASTEITKQRTLENERKRLVAEADERLKETQLRLDEIDRQRQELLERWTERAEAKESAERLLRESRSETEHAEGAYRKATEERDKEIASLRQVEEEKLRYESRLRDAIRKAVNTYLHELGGRVEQALVSEEERARRQMQAEAFRRARHEDFEIGNLCDQRDQFRELIRLTKVPAVAETLRRELDKVERELNARYPGALAIDEKPNPVMLVEDLYFLTGSDGLLRILMPVDQQIWERIREGDTGPEATCAMKIVWEVINGLKLSSEDGEFRLEDGRCVFLANAQSGDDVATRGDFAMSLKNSSITFRLSSLPAQVQEALSYETADS